MLGTARIGTLRVRTAGGSGTVTARALVEDAVRTSGADAGPGLLVVRRLALGPARNRQLVADSISRAMADARARAVRPDAPGAAQADAVLFRDEAEPYLLYADALARGSTLAGAWFFRSIFGHAGAPQGPAGIAVLVVRAAAEPFAPALVPALLRQAGDCVADVLMALSPAQALEVVQGMAPGVAPAARTSRSGARPLPDPPKQRPNLPENGFYRAARTLARALGAEDPRTVLAAAVLAQEIPGAAAPPERVHAFIEIIASAEQPVAFEEEAQASGAKGQSDDQRQVGYGDTVAQTDTQDFEIAAVANHPGLDVARPVPENGIETRKDAPSAREGRTGPRNAEQPQSLSRPQAFQQASDAKDTSYGRGEETARAPRADPQPDATVTTEPLEPETPQNAGHSEAGEPSLPDLGLSGTAPLKGVPTAWAGIVLVVPLLERFLPGLVVSRAGQAALLGRRLLDRMLVRAGCPDGDPARRAFGPADPAATLPEVAALEVPAALYLVAEQAELELCNIADQPGWRALTAARGRLVLAIWQGWAPPPVRGAVAGRTVRRGQSVAAPVPRLLVTAELVVRHAIRETTALAPRQLVGRNGWLSASRTHVDVSFDAGLVDLSIRRAGLDVDPGWCPWFGRVVAIHYDYGGDDA